MNIDSNMMKVGLAALVLTALTACGGGGGDSLGGVVDDLVKNSPDPDPIVSKTFSLSLASVKIERLSTGEEVKVDTSAVQSGALGYTP